MHLLYDIFLLLLLIFVICARCEEGGGVKLWGVDMNLSRTFSLGDYGGVVRALSRTKVCHMHTVLVINICIACIREHTSTHYIGLTLFLKMVDQDQLCWIELFEKERETRQDCTHVDHSPV